MSVGAVVHRQEPGAQPDQGKGGSTSGRVNNQRSIGDFLMWQKTPCPSSSDLNRLIDGTLTASDQKAIDRHLWFCGLCQTHLESLAYDEDGSPRSISCPDHAVLNRHLDGTVSAHAQEAIEHHHRIVLVLPGYLRGHSLRRRD